MKNPDNGNENMMIANDMTDLNGTRGSTAWSYRAHSGAAVINWKRPNSQLATPLAPRDPVGESIDTMLKGRMEGFTPEEVREARYQFPERLERFVNFWTSIIETVATGLKEPPEVDIWDTSDSGVWATSRRKAAIDDFFGTAMTVCPASPFSKSFIKQIHIVAEYTEHRARRKSAASFLQEERSCQTLDPTAMIVQLNKLVFDHPYFDSLPSKARALVVDYLSEHAPGYIRGERPVFDPAKLEAFGNEMIERDKRLQAAIERDGHLWHGDITTTPENQTFALSF